MKKDLTELVFILDRSGSMSGLESDTIGGFNAMLRKQRGEPGECYVSTVLFSNSSEVLHDRVKLAEVPDLTDKDYTVGGCTALLDAIGDAVHHISNIHKYARPEDVPEHTMFVITTDGLENASRRYGYDQVKKIIEQKKELGWEFLFVGANIDAVEVASRVGISAERTANYCADSTGTGVVFEALNAPIAAMRGGRKITRAWAETIEEDLQNRGKK